MSERLSPKQLRAHLDRRPPAPHLEHCPRSNGPLEFECECSARDRWRIWFDEAGDYLGERSARRQA